MSSDDIKARIEEMLLEMQQYIDNKYKEQGGCKYCNNTCPYFMACEVLNKLLKNEPVGNKYQIEVISNWIVKQNEYFRIIKENLANRKTPIYHIETLNGIPLGEIKWYGAWRKFCFFPYEETVWDMKCLTDIIKFLDKTNKEWREKK